MASSSSAIKPCKIVSNACSKCKKEQQRLKQCSSCKCAQYCSVECQAGAWPAHQALCKQIAKQHAVVAETRRVMIRESFSGDEKVFEEYVGKLYGFVDARPYLRAFRNLGTLWVEMAEAEDDPRGFRLGKAVYMELLRFTEADNQGVRMLVPFVLLQLGEIQETVDFVKARCWRANKKDGERRPSPAANIFKDFLKLKGDWLSVPDCDMDAEGLLALVIVRFMIAEELKTCNHDSWLVKMAVSKKMLPKDAAVGQMKIFIK
jgi:hypothetical protein